MRVVKSFHKVPVNLVLDRIGPVMASKRQQDECRKQDKKKKKKKCEEAAELCSWVEDEQVKSAVKEAWSRRSHCSHGKVNNRRPGSSGPIGL